MLIIGAIIGAAAFFVGGCTNWAGENIAPRFLFMALILAIFFIPAYGGAPYDVRGNGEMFPLNGPSWSLFFEYIGNILYAIFIRRLSTRWLKLFTAILGISFIIFATTNASGYGNIGVGWTLDTTNFFGGLLRMLFPFTGNAATAHPGNQIFKKTASTESNILDMYHCPLCNLLCSISGSRQPLLTEWSVRGTLCNALLPSHCNYSCRQQ